MFNLSWSLVVGLLATGLIAGLGTYHLALRWQARQRRRFPNRWPLDARGLLTTQEHQVWHWLKGAFYDHHVLIKTPLSRFTRPRNKREGKACAHMLGSMFTTFTVCTADGTVMGCVDVPGKKGLLLSHRDTKEGILCEV